MSYGTIQIEKMTTESGYSLGAGNASSFKNRLINGAMQFDQRNGGASVTPVALEYQLDRWRYLANQPSKITVQQSTTAPTGFTNSMLVTSSSAYSPVSTDYFLYQQFIEGLNCFDLAWGTASAKSVTLSFWVRSSLTGTFGGTISNSARDRVYPFTYTISSANTWEQKSVTIPGDTTGTWLTTNGRGIAVEFSLGSGTSVRGTPNVWAATDYRAATGETNVVATSGATWYITGVQLEVGTVATSFDFRSYGTELALCQRYYQHRVPTWGTPRPNDFVCHSSAYYKVTMRATPTLVLAYNTYGQTPVSIQDQSADYYVTFCQLTASSSLAVGFNASAEL